MPGHETVLSRRFLDEDRFEQRHVKVDGRQSRNRNSLSKVETLTRLSILYNWHSDRTNLVFNGVNL